MTHRTGGRGARVSLAASLVLAFGGCLLQEAELSRVEPHEAPSEEALEMLGAGDRSDATSPFGAGSGLDAGPGGPGSTTDPSPDLESYPDGLALPSAPGAETAMGDEAAADAMDEAAGPAPLDAGTAKPVELAEPVEPAEPDPCGPLRTICDGQCVDLSADPDHCGRCGGRCFADSPCVDGVCCHEPEAGGTCSVEQCGCGPDQECYPDLPETGMQCYPRGGVPLGGDCFGAECAEGGCYGQICKSYCRSDEDCPGIEGARNCLQTTYGVDGSIIAGVLVCARVCDPVSPQAPRAPLLACPPSRGCYPVSDGATDCSSTLRGDGVADEGCDVDDDCRPGLACEGTCTPYCYDDDDCDGTPCEPFDFPQRAGARDVGRCSKNCDPVRPGDPAVGLFPCPDGFGCYPGFGDYPDSRCFRHDGSAGESQACNADADCVPGMSCRDRRCIQRCYDGSDCTSGECINFYGDVAGGVPVGECLTPCDPVSPQAPRAGLFPCPGGFGCYPSFADVGDSYCYRLDGNAPEGAPCNADGDCRAGTVCRNLECVAHCYDDEDCGGRNCNLSFAGWSGDFDVGECEPF